MSTPETETHPERDLRARGSEAASERRARRADWLGTLLRLVLGGVLLVAGALKVGHPTESARAVQAYQLLPFDLARLVGYGLPLAEIIVGVLLILGLLTRGAAVIATLMMVAFVIGIVSAWARGLSIDCGCFGGGGTIAKADTAYPFEVTRDGILTLMGAYLSWRPRSAVSLDRRWYGH